MFGHFTYLVFEVVWAVPVLAVQWLVGRAILWRQVRLLVLGTLAPWAYFSMADAIAIHERIWTLNPGRITLLRIGPLPVEEAIFFLVTTLMVVQGLLLFTSPAFRMPWHSSTAAKPGQMDDQIPG